MNLGIACNKMLDIVRQVTDHTVSQTNCHNEANSVATQTNRESDANSMPKLTNRNSEANSIATLTNRNSDANLFAKLRRLKSRSEFVDVTLVSNDGYSCQVHACVVAAQSNFLHHWLSSQFKTRKTSKESNKPTASTQPATLQVPQTEIHVQTETVYKHGLVVCFDQLSSVMLHSCVKYMYGEDIDIPYKNLDELAKAASILKLVCLEERCREVMAENEKQNNDTLVTELPRSKDHTELLNATASKSDLRTVRTNIRQRKNVVAKKRAKKNQIKETVPAVVNNAQVLKSSTQSNSEKSSSLPDSADVMFYYDEASGSLQMANPCVNKPEVELDPSVMELIARTVANKQTTSTAAGEVEEVELDPLVMELIAQTIANKQTTGAAKAVEEVELEPSVLDLIAQTVANKQTTAAQPNTSSTSSRNAQNNKARAKVGKKCATSPKKRIKRSKEVAAQIAKERKRLQRKLEKTEEWVCDLCGLKCIGRMKFQLHMTVVHKREHTCKYCDRAFCHKWALSSHIARHEKQYSVLCDQCDFRCLDAPQLRYHKRKVHSNEPFPCSKCSAVFPTQYALIKHRITHRELVKCDKCDFVTQQAFKLNYHIEEFHTNIETACSYCKRVFGSFHKARRHELKVHGKLGKVTGLGLKKRFRTPDFRYGTVEDTHLAAELTNKLNTNRSDVTNNERPESPSVGYAETKNATQVVVETSNHVLPTVSESTDVIVDQDVYNLDTSDMNLVLTEECADIAHALTDVIYVEEGTGRILSEEEVLRCQLQVVHSQEF